VWCHRCSIKRSVILFAKEAPDPAKSALGAIKFLASELNASMTSPNARVELEAFGGAKGDKGSDARRLSLKRALAIRQVLIDDGVAPDRIDVHANGGVDDTGPADRVDVFVKA
jgi:outer membrane protein OmpA-like peptidoglycan-associated protein